MFTLFHTYSSTLVSILNSHRHYSMPVCFIFSIKQMAFSPSMVPKLLFTFIVTVSGMIRLSESINVTIINYCNETIWPGITPNNLTGFSFTLRPSQSSVFTAPPAWTGRIWARTGCNFDRNGNGTCQTGGCGTSLQCTGPGNPPASIAEFTLGDMDYYGVSLVDGFNLPLVVKPVGGRGNCSTAGCDNDIRPTCPPELTLRTNNAHALLACRSACDVFDREDYCCRGDFSTPATCLPTNYSRIFKSACPAAYSYAYDDPTSIKTCSSTDYVVSFCSGARNQTKCTYHDNEMQLLCNGTMRLLTEVGIWRLMVIVFGASVISMII